MAKRYTGLPRPERRIFKKSDLTALLRTIDSDAASTRRVLALEIEFRRRIRMHVESLPAADATFRKFNTNPFVLMIHCMNKSYSRISQIESDILPAKLFSSMETSAGRMIETVALPAYGWDVVLSEMHSANSALDGKQVAGDTLRLATIKSGPRCLNDEMSENFADSIIARYQRWAEEARVRKIDFTYGALYGTPRSSNKKDWHILRNIAQKMPSGSVTILPNDRWDCAFTRDGIEVKVSIRIGSDWWTYLGGDLCLIEICTAMIRACVSPGDADPATHTYAISDLAQIVSTSAVPDSFNVSILQHSQLAWLFFLARHFCDDLHDG